MDTLLNEMTDFLPYIVLGLIAMNLIFFIVLITLAVKISKIQAKYEQFMHKENINIEETLINYAKRIKDLNKRINDNSENITVLNAKMKTTLRKVSLTRYQAIQNVGADLSFVVAMLDDENNGVVLNGIYSRDGSYTYAKPVVAGESRYTLSGEENATLTAAINRK